MSNRFLLDIEITLNYNKFASRHTSKMCMPICISIPYTYNFIIYEH